MKHWEDKRGLYYSWNISKNHDLSITSSRRLHSLMMLQRIVTACSIRVTTLWCITKRKTRRRFNMGSDDKKKLPTFTSKKGRVKLKLQDRVVVTLKEERTLLICFIIAFRERPGVDLQMYLGNMNFLWFQDLWFPVMAISCSVQIKLLPWHGWRDHSPEDNHHNQVIIHSLDEVKT